MTRELSLGKKIVFLFFSFLFVSVLFLCLEIGARLLFPGRPSVDISHPILNHTWRPNFTWVDEEGNRCHYNAQGWLEEKDISPEKPAGTYRIFYVGDSNTEGTRPPETSMPGQVEVLLREAFPENPERFDVINTGTSSYSPLLFYLLIKNNILPLAPDLVVINLDMTDIFDDYLYQDTAQYDDKGELLACPPGHQLKGRYERTEEGLVKLSWKGQLYNFLKLHSRLFVLLKDFVVKFRKERKRSAAEVATTANQTSEEPGLRDWCLADWSPKTEQMVAFSMDRLAKTIRLLHSQGVHVAITGVPHRPHFIIENGKRFTERPFEALQQLCETEGAVYIDTYGGFLKRFSPEAISDYYRESIHFNREGYRIWAEIQVEALLDPVNRLLPENLY